MLIDTTCHQFILITLLFSHFKLETNKENHDLPNPQNTFNRIFYYMYVYLSKSISFKKAFFNLF